MSHPKLAIVVSHPIQHFCPQYSSWSGLGILELKVFFASRHGLDSYHDENFAREVKWENIKLDFDHSFLPGAVNRKPNAKIDCDSIEPALASFDPEIVLVYGYIQPLQRRAIRWSKRNGKQLLLIGDSELRQSRRLLKSIAKMLWLPRLFADMDLFLTVGDANEAYYRSYGVPDHKLVRTFFPIDYELFDQYLKDRELRRVRVRHELGVSDDHMVVLMVGKLVPWKRQADLIAVSNLLQPAHSLITMVFAGTGPDEKKLRAQAKLEGPGGAIFAGFVRPENLVEYYFAADVYVHCSAKEPHSLAISEAIYAGLPVVVSSRCGSYGPSDDVQVGLNGYVYPCGDVMALKALLEKYFNNTALRKKFGRESSTLGVHHQSLAHGKAIQQVIDIVEAN